MSRKPTSKRTRPRPKAVLRLSDLDQARSVVLNRGERLTEKAVCHVVREYAAKAGIDKLAPHDLRRACARLCQTAGGELEQIQFLLGHISIQTTKRYLGCKQKIQDALNEKIGIEPPG
jgi:site-specific recombinase XerD